MNENTIGVSVVICSHNGGGRIGQTISHLNQQTFSDIFPWEVIVVDNASTDDLVNNAHNFWQNRAPLIIIREKRLGLIWARIAGARACHYEFIVFADDDNWLCPDYVQKTYENFIANKKTAVFGGDTVGRIQGDPPSWFERYSKVFAVGKQFNDGGMSQKINSKTVWGAGMAVRRSALIGLLDSGFQPLLVGRIGNTLLSGEETELQICLRFSGWEIAYDPSMILEHAIPVNRLNWKYLLRLKRGFGASSVYTGIYTSLEREILSGVIDYRGWWKYLLMAIFGLFKDPLALLAGSFGLLEGNHRVVVFHAKLGELVERLRLGKQLDVLYHRLRRSYL